MSKTIIMEVPREGISLGKTKTKFETTGFIGAACKTASAFLAHALGTVTDDVATEGMYLTDQNVERLTEGG